MSATHKIPPSSPIKRTLKKVFGFLRLLKILNALLNKLKTWREKKNHNPQPQERLAEIQQAQAAHSPNPLMQENLWYFHGGIHPQENKAQTAGTPILSMQLPAEFIIPLRQHIGTAAPLCVSVGDRVLKGQPLTRLPVVPSHKQISELEIMRWREEPPLTCCVHAPTSGIITAIEPRPANCATPSDELCVILQTDFEDEAAARTPLLDHQTQPAATLITHLQQMGIVGLGGAGFITAQKLISAQNSALLIVNGVECEPYITADDRLMQEYSAQIVQGIEILQQIIKPKQVIIAIEDNKPDAIAAMTRASIDRDWLRVQAVPTKYPSGAERQLIEVLTGMQVPTGKHPFDIGILMQNVATVFAIKRAVIDGEPLIERVVTLAGETLHLQANRWVRIGTPLEFLLKQHAHKPQAQQRLIIGGPMMGYCVPDARIPVTKTTNCVLVPSSRELAHKEAEQACIRCGQCEQVCPASLQPQQLFWFASHQELAKCEKANLAACIECGACSFICPSKIDLVQYYRNAKAQIAQQAQKKAAADIAKARFEARQIRLEQEKRQREQHNLALQQASKPASETAVASNQAAVAAAIARVKARQQQAKSEQAQAQPLKAPSENTNVASPAPAALTPLADKKETAESNDFIEPAQNTPDAMPLKAAPTQPVKIGVAPAQPMQLTALSRLTLQAQPALSTTQNEPAVPNANAQDSAEQTAKQPQEDK
ncbi:MAG: electron transport complex subunit RsxC [Vibrionaceae bacterium]